MFAPNYKSFNFVLCITEIVILSIKLTDNEESYRWLWLFKVLLKFDEKMNEKYR